MSAVGYAVMPVIPSFDGITREINAKISGPLEKASKKAGEGIEKGVGSGVDAAADRVEKANYRVKKSAEELKDAESKRNAEMLKSQAAVKQLEAAESKLADIKKSGVASADQLAKAESDVLTKRAKVESAASAVEKAERGVEKAMSESARASQSLEKAQKDLESATDGSAEATGKFAKAAGDADGASGRFEVSLKQIAVAATATIAAVGAVGKAAFELGSKFDDAYDTIRIGTGASGAAFEDLQNSMRNVARDSIGVGSDLGEIGTTLADLNTRLGVTGKPLEKLTSQFQQLKGMGMETDINAVSGAFQQFGVQAEQMPGMMDTLFQISQATGRSMDDLVGNLSKSGPALQQFGFGLTESAGLLGALDKAGLDADKTMMSMTRALGEFAKEGKNPQEALWGTIQQIDELTKAGKGMEALDLANKIFGAKGGAGFVAAVESGQFAYEDFLGSIGASGDTISGLADETASFAEKWDQFKLRAMLALEPVAMAVFDALVPALESAWGAIEKATVKFQELGEWVQRNTEWLLPLAAAVGAAAGAWAAWHGAIAAWQGITKAATAVQAAFNAVMAANPIMLAVMAIAALVAGLTVFFTKTETGRQMWASFMDALQSGWERVQPILVAGFEAVKDAFAKLGDLVKFVWDGVIKPTFDALAAVAQWLWDSVLMPAFEAIKAGFQAVGDGIQWVWESIIKPVFDALSEVVSWLWQTVFVNAVEGIKILWEGLGAGFRFILDTFIQPAIDAFGAGLNWLHDNVVAPVTGWIGDKWRQLGDAFNAVKDFVVNTVFGGFKSGLDTLQGWVGTAADAIGRIWSAIKRKFAEPINFVINLVYNKGIKKVFDGVAEKVGLDARLPSVPTIGGFARGGQLPGYTPGRDVYDFYTRNGLHIGLSGGEGILVPEAQRALGKKRLEELNKVARQQGVSGAARYIEHMGGFARGGIVPSLGGFAKGGYIDRVGPGAMTDVTRSQAAFVSKFFPGVFTLTSALRFTDKGNHSVGLATDWSNGGMAGTPQMKQLAKAVYDNFPNSKELIHWPLAGWQNLQNGAPKNFGQPTNDQHRNHVHWATSSPLRFDGKDIVLDDAPGAGGFSFNPLGFFDGLASKFLDKIPKFNLPDFGEWAKVPGAALKTMTKMVKDWAIGKLKEWGQKFMNFMGFGGGGAEQWSDQATEALRRLGYGPEHLGRMLKQIQIESGGDPRAVNNWDSNAAKGIPSGGLLQVVEPTYRDMRRFYPEAFEGLPDDRFHPMTNLVAGVAWTKHAYGGPGNVWPTRAGYASGGVLPGWTPGRDVHHFFSPTGGALSLSGGESIMVPEWTRAVGGPAAVAAMNKAARFGRGVTGGRGFAAGGVWGGPGGDPMRDLRFAADSLQLAAKEITTAFRGGDFGYGALAAVLRNEQWAKSIVQGAAQLGKIADPTTLEGIFARSFAAETAGVFGDLGLANTADVMNTLVSAEKRLSDARIGHSERLADIAQKEEELELARAALAEFDKDNTKMSVKDARKLADAEKAVADAKAESSKGSKDQAKATEKVAKAEEKLRRVREDLGVKDKEAAAKRAEQQVKAAEDVDKAEKALAESRKKSANALDWTLYDIAPQVFEQLNAAAERVGKSVPQAGAALHGLAAAAGPAGVSIGVAIQGLKSAIQVAKMVVGLVNKIIDREVRGRTESWKTLTKVLDTQAEWGRMVEDQYAKVVDLRVEMANALMGYRDAAWKARLAQDGVARAQLEGVVGVRQAEAKLAEFRATASKQAIYDFRDMSLEYDRYRWNEFKGIAQRGAVAAKVSAEMLALEADVNIARLQAEITQREADMAHLEAVFEQQKAAVHLMRTMQSLEQATAELARMQATLHGYDQKGMLTASNTAKMYTELAEVEGRMQKNWWSLRYQLGGGKSADKAYADQLRKQIAEREAQGKGVQGVALDDATMRQLTKLAKQGRTAEMESLWKSSPLGTADRAIFETKERQALADIDKRRQDLEYMIADSRLELAQHGKLAAMRRDLEALQRAKASEQYRAEGLRAENAGVREAHYALTEFEAKRAVEYRKVPSRTVVDISLPAQDVYTREQVDALVDGYRQVPGLVQRVNMLETPAKPGANELMRLTM